MFKLFILTVILGAAVAEPLRLTSNNDVVYSDGPNYELAKTDATSVIELLFSLIGIKTSAIAFAVTAIEWIVSNFFVVLLGAAGVLGFCKFTGKCNLDYEQYIPISQIQGLATPENLETAERIFLRAVDQYAEMRRGDM